jgi:hypothetical protein
MLKKIRFFVLALILANLFVGFGCQNPFKDKTEQTNRGGGDEDPGDPPAGGGTITPTIGGVVLPDMVIPPSGTLQRTVFALQNGNCTFTQ